MVKFYDTCSLLKKVDTLFPTEDNIVISTITLGELENIKTSSHKDVDIKFAARKLIHLLEENNNQYEIIPYLEHYGDYVKEFELTPDMKILASAIAYATINNIEDKIVFVTNDLALKQIAKQFIAHVDSVPEEDEDNYVGYLEVTMTDEEMNYFYMNMDMNLYNLCINQYLVIYNTEGEVIDRLCWTGTTHRNLNYDNFNSRWFGKVRPYQGDVYQQLAADSLSRNQITMIKGPAGSGKTYLALGFLMYKLEAGDIDKIIVFCNTVATKNSAKLGYYPGTRDEKLLDSQIGNLLSSKFGSKMAVESMIEQERLVLLPLADIRGYDTSGMNAGVYISEAQNMDVELMKLTLQRIGEDSICIIDGDEKTQVDDIHFAGVNNGMKRVSKVFRDHDLYGEVRLKQIHRSKIASIADLL